MHDSSLYQQEHRRVSAKREERWSKTSAPSFASRRSRRAGLCRLYDRLWTRYSSISTTRSVAARMRGPNGQVFLRAWEAIGSYQLTEKPFRHGCIDRA